MRSLARKLNRDFSVIKSEFIGNLADDKKSDVRINVVEKAEGALEELVVKSLSGDNASFNTVIAGVISADFAHITDGVIDNATIDHASVNGLSANYAEIENGVIKNANIDQAQVRNLSTYYAHITNGKIDNATIDVADVNDLNANYAHITNGTIDNATIDVADVNDLSANYAHITNGVIDNAKIKVADVNDLNANYATINLANVNNAWIENGVIKKAAISDAQIIGMSANKLTAGTIDASKIYVTNLNADNITVGTINGQRIGNASIDLSKLAEEVPTKEYLDSVQQNLQGQIDGQIETWTSSEVPLLSNYPASSWTDQKTRKAHVGDVLYIVNAASDADGYCYRFSEDSSGAFSWVLIKDSDVTKALKELIDVQGDVHGLQSFQSETSSWITNTDEELSSLKTNQTTLETNLGKKVETSVFNQLSQTVSENSASITSLSDTVDKKADGSTVTTLGNTVNSVKQTADSNTASISNLTTTVNDHGSRLTNAETSITQNADQISLRATKTEAQGYANNAVSGLQIGGRNMLRNTDTFRDWNVNNSSGGYQGILVDNKWNGKAAIVTDRAWNGAHVGFDKIFPKYSIQTGDIITLSQWFMFDFSPVKDFSFSIYRSGEDNTNTGVISAECTIPSSSWSKTSSAHNILIHKDDVDPNVWYKIAFTFPAPSTLNEKCRIEINYYTTSDYKFGTNGEKMYIAGCKFERGNKSTDWTPAEEDIDTRISSAETAIEQNANEINLRATKTEAQGYANTAKSDAINSAASDATSKANKALADAKSFTTSQGYLTVNSDKITAMVSATTAAQTSANNAQSTANTAKTNAVTAQSTANTANSTANSVKTDLANNYYTKTQTDSAAIEITKNQIKNIVISPSGGTTATQSPDGFTWTISSPTVPTKVSQLSNDSSFQTEAQVASAASDAAKTATDFMKFSAEKGLIIGDYTSGELSGASTNIKPDGLRIYDQSSNEMAHFLADEARVANLFIETNYESPEHKGYEGARIVAHNQDDYTSNRLLEIQSGFGLSPWATGIVLINNIPSKEISKIEFKWCDGSTLQQKRAEIHDLFGYTTKTVEGVKWRIRKTPYMTEAWATITRTITGGMTNDGVWGYSVKADAVKYPTNLFSSAPKVMISSRGPFGYPMLVGNGTAASTPVMYFYRPTDYDNITVYFDLYVIGE